MKEKSIKLIITFILVLSYFFLPKYGFTSFGAVVPEAAVPEASAAGFLPHLLYPLSHANIWHLAANVLCLWMLRCPLHLLATCIIAVLCSFLPSYSLYDTVCAYFSCTSAAFSPLSSPTMGFSGVLFAIVGISWGRVHRFRDMLWRNKWYLVIPAFLPHVNFLIHIYCLLAGYLYGYCAQRFSAGSKNS